MSKETAGAAAPCSGPVTGRIHSHPNVFDLKTHRKKKRKKTCFHPARLRGMHRYLEDLYEQTAQKKTPLSFEEMCLLNTAKMCIGALARREFKEGIAAYGELKGSRFTVHAWKRRQKQRIVNC